MMMAFLAKKSHLPWLIGGFAALLAAGAVLLASG